MPLISFPNFITLTIKLAHQVYVTTYSGQKFQDYHEW